MLPEDLLFNGVKQVGEDFDKRFHHGYVGIPRLCQPILDYQNSTFFGGDCISMIDYLLWPWFERLDVYGISDCVNHTPALQLWIAAMKQDPTVCSLLIDKTIFQCFLNLYFQNNPAAFDFGLCC
ncbi:PREDICTED: glutathione S-transferase omega-2 [Galeopterus variegatus]|uniref:Glutathione-dependent dehydroascorbate reductase n=1 Tax=Galeopterus variegatus TaxID=482537 RepID=A0ABM0R3B8_GALVR|nr:PREDICTED: glutathione S-transferase omega-2 [Galeopterus variegatus]